MKVIIFPSYGTSRLPSCFKVDYSDSNWRFSESVLSQIESIKWNMVYTPNTKTDRNKHFCIPKDEYITYYYSTPDGPTPFNVFMVFDVNIKRPWCIEEYDGAESIHYLDDYVCLNKEYNYFKRK